MDLLGHELLARAALPYEEDGRVGRCDPLDRLEQPARRFATSDEPSLDPYALGQDRARALEHLLATQHRDRGCHQVGPAGRERVIREVPSERGPWPRV
jgi:hypothetical protein